MKTKRLIIVALAFILTMLSIMACGNTEWETFDYSKPEQKFKAEQILKINDDDDFTSFFECRVWCHKRLLFETFAKEEYFEGYIAKVKDFDYIYIFIFDLAGNYEKGDYSECGVIDFNDEKQDEFADMAGYAGHYKIDKIEIKKK